MTNIRNNYLIHIRFAGDILRCRQASEKAWQTVKKLSNDQCTTAYTTEKLDILGIIANCDKPAAYIRAAIDGSSSIDSTLRNRQQMTGLENGDTILVIELGRDISEKGYNTLPGWLKNH
jgi:hypothetical protein